MILLNSFVQCTTAETSQWRVTKGSHDLQGNVYLFFQNCICFID